MRISKLQEWHRWTLGISAVVYNPLVPIRLNGHPSFDESAAAAREDGRAARNTRPVFLAALGRRVLEPESVRSYAAADRGVVASGWIGLLVVTTQKSVPQNTSAGSGV